MKKSKKLEVVADLTEKLKDNNTFYVIDAGGMTVAETNDFRRLCYGQGLEYRVYKNTLIRRALDSADGDFSEMNDVLKGFSGVLFSPESPKAPATVIKSFKKKFPAVELPVLKAAAIDTDVFVGAEHLDMLANIKSKEELIGEVITILQSPAKNVISALQSGKSILGGLMKTLSER